MKYPTLNQYTDSLLCPKSNFRSAKFKGLKLCTDLDDEPIYRSGSRSVVYDVIIDGERKAIRLFTSKDGRENYNGQGELFSEELLVVMGQSAVYFDVVLEGAVEYGKPKLVVPDAPILSENRLAFSVDGKWGYKNGDNEVVIEPRFSFAGEFHEGRAVVAIGEGYGLIDPSGKMVIEAIYEDLSYDNSNYSAVMLDGLCGIVDRLGNEVVARVWDWVGEYSEDMVLVSDGGKYGYLDSRGVVALEVQYDEATSFSSSGYAQVKLKGRSFMINKQGERVSSYF